MARPKGFEEAQRRFLLGGKMDVKKVAEKAVEASPKPVKLMEREVPMWWELVEMM